GGAIPTMPPWHVQENKWRAARYGLDAIIILNAAGDELLVTDHLRAELERLAPVAERLGCAAELASVWDIVAGGGAAAHQRRVAAAALRTGAESGARADAAEAEGAEADAAAAAAEADGTELAGAGTLLPGAAVDPLRAVVADAVARTRTS